MKYLIIVLVIGFMSCKSSSQEATPNQPGTTLETPDTFEEMSETSFLNSKGEKIEKVFKSTEEWKKQLSKMEYYVLREKGTERAHTGDLLNVKKDGIYTCAACGLDLFASDTKYESGTGWPSFYKPLDSTHILEDTDYNLGYARTEVLCKKCGGHLGHVFNDGPKPTGLRYCLNPVSLNFKEK